MRIDQLGRLFAFIIEQFINLYKEEDLYAQGVERDEDLCTRAVHQNFTRVKL